MPDVVQIYRDTMGVLSVEVGRTPRSSGIHPPVVTPGVYVGISYRAALGHAYDRILNSPDGPCTRYRPGMSDPPPNRTVVFGLDGACFDLVQPWLDDGRLPTLQGLLERGGGAPLESCVPATTPPAWTSLTTGVNPGKHGIFGFYGRRKATYDVSPVSDGDVHAQRLWDYTTMADRTALVVNVPVTHPARELDGVLVPGYLAPEDETPYPPDLFETLDVDGYRIYAPSESGDVDDDQLVAEWLSLTESRIDLTRRLLDTVPDWDLLFLEFQKTDGAVHKFDDLTHVRRIYECVDEGMGSLLARMDDPNVFVVSDHGIGQEKAWAVSLNTWLRDNGYLHTKVHSGPSREHWRESAPSGAASAAERGGLAGALAAAGLTRQRVERVLAKVGLYEAARRLSPERLKSALTEESVDFESSTAFYQGMGFSGVDVGVVINDDRFYRNGVVSAAEYDRVRSRLMEQLEALEGPAGAPFTSAETRERVYHGDRTEFAPDVVLEQAPSYVIGSDTPRGKTFIETGGNRIDHTRDGLLVAAGPDVRRDWTVSEGLSILDVTPTLLGLMDVPLNRRFDGSPRMDILDVEWEPTVEDYPRRRPVGRTRLDNEDTTAMRNRLTELGYLE